MGGNVFKNAEPFDHIIVPEIVKQINQVIEKLGTSAITIGSCATPIPGKISGDLDMMLDFDHLAEYYQSHSVKAHLRKEFDQLGVDTALSGNMVHVCTYVGNTAQQVDIIVIPHAADIAKFHIHEIPTESIWKGSNKHKAMSHLAKKQNLLWSPFEGLYTRSPDGKKNKLYSRNVDDIAQILFGPTASAKNLNSFEAMMNSMSTEAADAMLKHLREDRTWFEDKSLHFQH